MDDFEFIRRENRRLTRNMVGILLASALVTVLIMVGIIAITHYLGIL